MKEQIPSHFHPHTATGCRGSGANLNAVRLLGLILVVAVSAAVPLAAVEINIQPSPPLTAPAGGSVEFEAHYTNPNPAPVPIEELTSNITSLDDATIEVTPVDTALGCTPSTDRQSRCTSAAPFTLAAGQSVRVRVRVRIPAGATQGSTRRISINALTRINGAVFTTSRTIQITVQGEAAAPKLAIRISRNPLIEPNPDGTFSIVYQIVVRNEGTAPTAGDYIILTVGAPKSRRSHYADQSSEWSQISGFHFKRDGALPPGGETGALHYLVTWPLERGKFDLHVQATDDVDTAAAVSSISIDPRLIGHPIPERPPAKVSRRGRRN